MTPLKVSIAASIASLVLLVIVFELIRSRRLRERYALLWLLTGVVLLVLSAWRAGLNTIARWVGVQTYPPAVLFAVGSLQALMAQRQQQPAVVVAVRGQQYERRPGRRVRGRTGSRAAWKATARAQQPCAPPIRCASCQ